MGLYARGTLRGILARGRGSTDREQHGSYKNDRGQYSRKIRKARKIRKYLIIRYSGQTWLFTQQITISLNTVRMAK